MKENLYCSMIHGGLNLDVKGNRAQARPCCLNSNRKINIGANVDFWNSQEFLKMRANNIKNIWDSGCSNCLYLENSGQQSFRQGMNNGLDIFNKTNISGPARIDLMFDISCNLACRTCGAGSSTFWQKHLRDHGEWNKKIFSPRKKMEVIDYLKKIDLSNLKQLVFCGGETLLGQEYWDVANYIINSVPNAKQQLTVCFQTNGTQPILEKNYHIIDRTFLVKLHVSLDGVEDQFEYLRWPAKWSDTIENLFSIKQHSPSNVMFVIEETVSIFNILYSNKLKKWVSENFNTNRDGDIVNHSKHLAQGIFNLNNLTAEIIDLLDNESKKLVSTGWYEDPVKIQCMINEIKKIDTWRAQSFKRTFPELADAYRRYL